MKRDIVLKRMPWRVVLAAAFMVAYLVTGFSHPVSAANEKFKGLLISPASNRFDLKNGQSYSGTMNVSNSTKGNMNVKMSVGSYVIINGNYGSPSYDSPSKYSVMKDWIKLDKQAFTLKPGENTDVTYTVTAPANPPAGMQYATIFAENQPENNIKSGIIATSRVGMVLSAHMVDGKTVDKSNIESVDIPWYQPTAPLKASFKIKNEGNIGADVNYSLTVKNAINGSESYKSGILPESVYPESSRSMSVGWDKVGVGFYNVDLTISLNGRSHTIHKFVCTVPIWIMILLAIAIISLIAYAVINYRLAKEARPAKSKKAKSRKK